MSYEMARDFNSVTNMKCNHGKSGKEILYGGAKGVYSCKYTKKQSILVLLFMNHHIIFHMNNCKSTFALPCILKYK